MAAKDKTTTEAQTADQLGMTVEQLRHVKGQIAAAKGRGRRPAGTAGAETKLAGWGAVEGQEQLFPVETGEGTAS